MMDIKIYQINGDKDSNRVRFTSMAVLCKLTGSNEVDSSIYNRVFAGEVDCKTLEDVYVMFNVNYPKGYVGCSLSVSDVIEVVQNNGKSVFYFCDSFGFKRINFNPEKCEIVNVFHDTETISALLVQPNKPPEVVEIDNNLTALQDIVGGYIEVCKPFGDNVAIICNEEGKVNCLPPNRAIYGNESCNFCCNNRRIADVIHGDFILVSAPEGSEKFESLPRELMVKYTKRFLYPETFLRAGSDILVFPVKPVLVEKER